MQNFIPASTGTTGRSCRIHPRDAALRRRSQRCCTKALAILVGAGWASGRDISSWLGIGLLGCSVVGAWALWLGVGLTPAQVMSGLAELNVYYRILRDQGAPFPFASPRPFSRLLLGLGLTLIVGWALAAVCWLWDRRRGAFVSLVIVAGVITVLVFQLLDVVQPHHSAKEVSTAITAEPPDDGGPDAG